MDEKKQTGNIYELANIHIPEAMTPNDQELHNHPIRLNAENKRPNRIHMNKIRKSGGNSSLSNRSGSRISSQYSKIKSRYMNNNDGNRHSQGSLKNTRNGRRNNIKTTFEMINRSSSS